MTIKDIAQAAGVSTATVSRIMNHKDNNISQETRERVLQIIQENGYTPYSKIRDRLLAGNKTIGLAIPTLNSFFYSSFASCSQQFARDNGYTLLLSITNGTAEGEAGALDSFRSSKTEGILFFPGSREGLQALEEMHAENYCAVVLDHVAPTAVFPQVYRDMRRIAKHGTKLLLEDCRSVALALRRDCGSIADETIRSGYKDALLEANVTLNPGLEVHPGADFDQVFDALIEEGIDGIVCQDAETAGFIYAAAAKKNIKIPEDLSVNALEDAPLSQQLTPPLSTGSVSPKAMASAAMEALFTQLEGKPWKFTAKMIFSTAQLRGSMATKQSYSSRIIVLGSMNMDVILHVPHLPQSGETLMTSKLTALPGGKGANQALAVSRLGGNSYMIGCLGNDRYGRQISEELSSAHVDTAGVTLTADLPTGTAYIHVCPDGDSTILVHSGANALVGKNYVRHHSVLLRSAKYCLIQMEIPFEGVQQALYYCKKYHVDAILKPSPVCPLPDELLDGLFMLIPNENEAAFLCPGKNTPQEQAQYLISKGVQNVIITLGSSGCLWSCSGLIRNFSAHPYPCVDSTGASDIFISCLAVMLSERNSIEHSIIAASWAASYSVSRMGVQNSIPSRDLLDEMIAKEIPPEGMGEYTVS
ncbi:MAG: LacI family DNA-binding transcriptional regulator [Lachnospiraceae bacterium]|nr:LacI family DNA-binding transcriptional regulator [Lachnospiraceae bacterium]MCI8995753.1 LacI family DNA-binding transcriptional regulator [Lachnospiraceae bacterium]MCI9134698.1 LacI family DNA-binding transcriptional regulator [Lachnospiraceae bacterium]